MAQAKLSLSWDAHQKNICNGLSRLQQSGEFVDMTLAADGHFVKVHQMVMALVSPYIKELISSASCPHPVIFLNNTSYTTLCAILEYVYMGEVHVPTDQLGDLIAVARALHIKGLKDMDEHDISLPNVNVLKEQDSRRNSFLIDKLQEYKEKKSNKNNKEDSKPPVMPVCKIFVGEGDQDSDVIMDELNESTDNWDTDKQDLHKYDDKTQNNSSNVQYTVSNQGGLQIVYNRYIYHLRYIQKNRSRLWRCVDYSSPVKCQAKLFSNNKNQVVKRSSTHNHPFHDAKIMKKIQLGTIYTAFQEAETKAKAKKTERNQASTPPPDESDTQ